MSVCLKSSLPPWTSQKNTMLNSNSNLKHNTNTMTSDSLPQIPQYLGAAAARYIYRGQWPCSCWWIHEQGPQLGQTLSEWIKRRNYGFKTSSFPALRGLDSAFCSPLAWMAQWLSFNPVTYLQSTRALEKCIQVAQKTSGDVACLLLFSLFLIKHEWDKSTACVQFLTTE